jgi:hypothetical protein
MRKALYLFLAFSLCVSCKKLFDEYRQNPGVDLRFCNIKTWTDNHMDELRENIFTYNEHGNPISVTSNHQGTGSGYHYFRYDEKQRLIEHEEEFVSTHYYHYEGTSRQPAGNTIIDAYGREFEETFTYDSKGRIIKAFTEFISSPFEDDLYPNEEKEYMYDDYDLKAVLWNGHQQNPEMVYSGKPSIYFSNKVWMLVNRNYSKHSPVGPATFNISGFPLIYHEEPPYQFPFLDINYYGSKITYDCR